MTHIINRPDPEKPTSKDLLHYGVKGMRWGIRRSDEELGNARKSASESKKNSASNADEKLASPSKGSKDISKDDWKKAVDDAAPKFKTEAEKKAAIKKDEKLFVNKFKSSDEPASSEKKDKSGPFSDLTTSQKVKIGVGATVVAGLIGYAVYKDYYTKKNYAEGERIPVFAFMRRVEKTKDAAWGGNYLKDPTVWQQDEFTIPKGQIFHRISQNVETKFNSATYCVSSDADYARYLAGFGNIELGSAVGQHHITFKALEDIRVPSLHQRLAAVHISMTRQYPEQKFTAADAAKQYIKWVGDSWNTEGSKAFLSVLREQGFDAIIDDMDAGVIGEAPLVIFNPQKFSSKKSTPITMKELKARMETLTEIPNRKLWNEGLEEKKAA